MCLKLGKGALLRPKVLLPALVVAQVPVPWGAGCNRETHHLQSGLQEQAMTEYRNYEVKYVDGLVAENEKLQALLDDPVRLRKYVERKMDEEALAAVDQKQP